MRLPLLILAAASLPLAAPVAAQENAAPSLESVLQMESRSAEAGRDQYRRPVETMAFFQVDPTMRIVEYGPGGGWYTRVLLPWIAPQGTYMALQGDTGPRDPAEPSWAEQFVTAVSEAGLASAEDVVAFESDEIPDDVAGTADRVLIFRSLHGMLNNNVADRELRAIRTLLADDGMVGVVQHRAPEDATYAASNGSRGYLRQSDVIRLFELNGFELVEASELNANPADTADWEGGVWTLPPVLRNGEADRERYIAIGESDRMTLLFRKRP